MGTRVIIAIIFLLALVPIFGQEEMENPVTENIINESKPYFTYSCGAAVSWLTRIIDQTGRSNFVLRDFLPGMYFSIELQDLPVFIPEVRLTAYYPLISTFNHVSQKSNTPLHFALDLFAGICFEINWGIVSLNAGPGLHLFYLTSDRWNYLNLGFALTSGFKFALNSNFSLLIDFIASLDNGNLGNNRHMEPFDTVFQYQTGIGIRYNRKKNTALLNTEDSFPILIR